MDIRHKLKYPPYTYIAIINIKSNNYDLTLKEANKVKKLIDGKLDKKTIIFNPTPASMFKVNNIYNFQIIIKYTFDDKLKNILKMLDELYITNKKVNIEINFNPSRF